MTKTDNRGKEFKEKKLKNEQILKCNFNTVLSKNEWHQLV